MKFILFIHIFISFLLGGVVDTPSNANLVQSFANETKLELSSSETIGLGELVIDSYEQMHVETNVFLESRYIKPTPPAYVGSYVHDPFTVVFFNMKTKDGRAIKEIKELTLNITYNKPLTDWLPIPFEKNKTSIVKSTDLRICERSTTNPLDPIKTCGEFNALGNADYFTTRQKFMEYEHKQYLKGNSILDTGGKDFYVILPFAWDVQTIFISACAVTVDGEVIDPSPEDKIFNLNSYDVSKMSMMITSDKATIDIKVPSTNLSEANLKIGHYDFIVYKWTNLKHEYNLEANKGVSYYNINLSNGDLIYLSSKGSVDVEVKLTSGTATFANITDEDGNLFPGFINEEHWSWINEVGVFLKTVGAFFNDLFKLNLPGWAWVLIIVVSLALLGPVLMLLINLFKFLIIGIKYLFIGLKWVIIGPFKLFNYLFIPKKKEQNQYINNNYKFKK